MPHHSKIHKQDLHTSKRHNDEPVGHPLHQASSIDQLQRTIGNKATRLSLTTRDAPDITPAAIPTSTAIQRSIFSKAKPEIEAQYKGVNYQFPTAEGKQAAEEFWKTHIRQSPSEVVGKMLVNMGDLITHEPLDIRIQLLTANSMEVLVQTQPKASGHTGPNRRLVINRQFIFQDGQLSVKENRTDVEGGLGKQLYRNLLPLYDSLGIEEITLEATETGKYAWARYGFLPKDSEHWGIITTSILSGNYGLKPALEDSLREELTAQLGEAAVKGQLTESINSVLASVLTPENLSDIASEMDAPQASNLDATFNNLVMKIVNDCLEEYFDVEGNLDSLNTAFGGRQVSGVEEKSGSDETSEEEASGNDEPFNMLYMSHASKIKQKVMNAVDLTGLKQAILEPAKAKAEDPRAAVGTLSREVFNAIDPEFKIPPENRVIPRQLAEEVVTVMTSPDPSALRNLMVISQRGTMEQKLIYLLMQKSEVWSGRLSLKGADRAWIEDYIKQAASSPASSSSGAASSQ